MTIGTRLTIEFSEMEERENVLGFLDTLDDFCNENQCKTCPLHDICEHVGCSENLYILARKLKDFIERNEL